MIIVLPNLNEGIQIVGFLKEIEEQTQNILSSRNEKEKNTRSMGYILYNSNTNALLGITQNCYDHFGIPASLVFGNGNNTSEFALDSIMPEVFDQINYESLKNNGIVCEIDTTMLKEHFFIGQNDSDEEMDDQLRNNHYENEDHHPNSNIINSVGLVPVYFNSKPKSKATGANYRKTKVRVLICDERFFEDINIATLQVVEERNELVGDNEENKDLKPHSTDIVMEVAVVEVQSQSDENLNEELRQLKDFKTLMSEKSENKNIRFLKRSVILLTTLLVSLTTVHIVYQQNQTNDMTIGYRSIYDSFDRRKVIASLCFDSRMLDLLAKG